LNFRVSPLTRLAFAPYGDIIGAEGRQVRSVNDGRAHRFDGLAAIDHSTGGDRPVLATYRIVPSPLPIAVTVFERHPRSSQVFLPMHDSRFLIGVAPSNPDGEPDIARAQVFVAAGVGIHYRADVWHVPLTVLDREAVFAMLMWETETDDTVEYRLCEPLLVECATADDFVTGAERAG